MENSGKAPQTDLTSEQKAAIKMLTSGCSIRYTALVLGVKRETVSAWIARDRAFKQRMKEAETRDPAEGERQIDKRADVTEVTEKLSDLVEE